MPIVPELKQCHFTVDPPLAYIPTFDSSNHANRLPWKSLVEVKCAITRNVSPFQTHCSLRSAYSRRTAVKPTAAKPISMLQLKMLAPAV